MVTINRDNIQLDPDLFLIVTPVLANTDLQTVVDNTVNLKLHGFGVNNKTASAATLTLTDGDGNELVTGASFTANQSQFVPVSPGYYFKNGLKLSSDTDDALVVWFSVRKM